MIKKFEIFNENKKQKDSLFFNLGDCPASLKVEYKNKEYEILTIADGEKRIYYPHPSPKKLKSKVAILIFP